MKIVALASYLSSRRGGLEHSLLDVCRSLNKRGHSITLLYEEKGDQFEAYQEFCGEMLQISSYHINPKFLPDLMRFRPPQGSVIYSNQYDNFFFASSLATLYHLPLVCHLRLHASIENSYLKRLKQSLTIAKINHSIAISQAVKDDWCSRLQIPQHSVNVVYNGIDVERFSVPKNVVELKSSYGVKLGEKVISYIGRLEKEKGIETLIKAFALLRQENIASKLLIAGKPLFSGEEYLSTVEKLTADLNISEDVRFLGHLSDPRPLYQVSDVNVLPSLWLEAFGRVIIESMASGTPSLGSRVGGIPEILTGEFSDWLFEPGNEHDLFVKLKNVLEWRDTDPNLAQRCRQHVANNFSLGKTIDGVEAILQQALNS